MHGARPIGAQPSSSSASQAEALERVCDLRRTKRASCGAYRGVAVVPRLDRFADQSKSLRQSANKIKPSSPSMLSRRKSRWRARPRHQGVLPAAKGTGLCQVQKQRSHMAMAAALRLVKDGAMGAFAFRALARWPLVVRLPRRAASSAATLGAMPTGVPVARDRMRTAPCGRRGGSGAQLGRRNASDARLWAGRVCRTRERWAARRCARGPDGEQRALSTDSRQPSKQALKAKRALSIQEDGFSYRIMACKVGLSNNTVMDFTRL